MDVRYLSDIAGLDDIASTVAFSPDGAALVIGGWFTERAKIYSVSGTTVTFVSNITALDHFVERAVFSPDGTTLVIGGHFTGRAKIYSVSGTTVTFVSDIYADTGTTALDGRVDAAAFSPDGTKLVLGGFFTGHAKIYSVSGTTITFVSDIYADTGTTALSSYVNTAAFSLDGTKLVLGGEFIGKAKNYSVSGTTVTFVSNIYADTGTTALDKGVYAAVFSSDGTELVLGGGFIGGAKVYSVNGTTVTFVSNIYADTGTTALTDYVSAAIFSPDGNALVLGGSFIGYAKFYSISGPIITFVSNIYADTGTTTLSSSVNTAAFSPSGTELVLGGWFTSYAKIYLADLVLYALTGLCKLPDPDHLPAGWARGVAFSHDSTYLAVAHGANPYILIYKRSGDTFTKLADPDVLPQSLGYKVAFSHDSTYLAIAHGGIPYVTVYKRNGDIFTKLNSIDVLPASTGFSVAFSHDSTYMAVGHAITPFITIYKRSGDTFTKLSNPTDLPPSIVYGVAFSPDSTHLVVAHSNAPYAIIYKRSGDVFTKILPLVDNVYNSLGRSVSFTSSGDQMVIGGYGTNYFSAYEVVGDTFTKLSGNIISPPPSVVWGSSFYYDDTYLAVVHSEAPLLSVFRREGTKYTKISEAEPILATTTEDCAFSPNGAYLAVAHNGAPYITIYSTTCPPAEQCKITFVDGILRPANTGYHLANGCVTEEHAFISTSLGGDPSEYRILKYDLSTMEYVSSLVVPFQVGAMVVHSNGFLYAGDGSTTNPASLLRIDPVTMTIHGTITGNAGETVIVNIFSSGNVLYVVCRGSSASSLPGRVYALNTTTGLRVFSNAGMYSGYYAQASTQSADFIFTGSNSGLIVRITKSTGSATWKQHSSPYNLNISTMACIGDRLYHTTWSNESSSTYLVYLNIDFSGIATLIELTDSMLDNNYSAVLTNYGLLYYVLGASDAITAIHVSSVQIADTYGGGGFYKFITANSTHLVVWSNTTVELFTYTFQKINVGPNAARPASFGISNIASFSISSVWNSVVGKELSIGTGFVHTYNNASTTGTVRYQRDFATASAYTDTFLKGQGTAATVDGAYYRAAGSELESFRPGTNICSGAFGSNQVAAGGFAVGRGGIARIHDNGTSNFYVHMGVQPYICKDTNGSNYASHAEAIKLGDYGQTGNSKFSILDGDVLYVFFENAAVKINAPGNSQSLSMPSIVGFVEGWGTAVLTPNRVLHFDGRYYYVVVTVSGGGGVYILKLDSLSGYTLTASIALAATGNVSYAVGEGFIVCCSVSSPTLTVRKIDLSTFTLTTGTTTLGWTTSTFSDNGAIANGHYFLAAALSSGQGWGVHKVSLTTLLITAERTLPLTSFPNNSVWSATVIAADSLYVHLGIQGATGVGAAIQRFRYSDLAIEISTQLSPTANNYASYITGLYSDGTHITFSGSSTVCYLNKRRCSDYVGVATQNHWNSTGSTVSYTQGNNLVYRYRSLIMGSIPIDTFTGGMLFPLPLYGDAFWVVDETTMLLFYGAAGLRLYTLSSTPVSATPSMSVVATNTYPTGITRAAHIGDYLYTLQGIYLHKIDKSTLTLVGTVELPITCTTIAAGYGTILVGGSGTIYKYSPDLVAQGSLPIADPSIPLYALEADPWVANTFIAIRPTYISMYNSNPNIIEYFSAAAPLFGITKIQGQSGITIDTEFTVGEEV